MNKTIAKELKALKERLPDDAVEIYEAHRRKDGTHRIGKLISRQE